MIESIILANRTNLPHGLIERNIESAIDAFHEIYPKPDCEIEIIICDSIEDFRLLSQEYVQEDISKESMKYDGRFICPKSSDEVFRILFVLSEDDMPGMERYVFERENGSLKDADMYQKEREKRGIDLMGFFHFLETLLHEYSHLCSFEQYMKMTNWADPGIAAHSVDYHLQDEFLARYRSTLVALRMLESFAERDLIYSIWMSYSVGAQKAYSKEKDRLQLFLDIQRTSIENEMEEVLSVTGMSSGELASEIERELGHKLENADQRNDAGIPILSDTEIVEYMMVDDFEDSDFDDGTTGEEVNDYLRRSLTPVLYYTRNRLSTYQASQLYGLVTAFNDFLCSHIDGKDSGSIVEKSYTNMVNVLEKPFQEFIESEQLSKIADRIKELILCY